MLVVKLIVASLRGGVFLVNLDAFSSRVLVHQIACPRVCRLRTRQARGRKEESTQGLYCCHQLTLFDRKGFPINLNKFVHPAMHTNSPRLLQAQRALQHLIHVRRSCEHYCLDYCFRASPSLMPTTPIQFYICAHRKGALPKIPSVRIV